MSSSTWIDANEAQQSQQGSRIHGRISFDGTTWEQLEPIQTVWPARLEVGVIATSSSGLPFSVAIEEYESKGRAK